MEANRKILETFLRYHFEQGITARRFTIEDIFVLDLLNT
jgi:4,5-dihydroxyphthalate decarboxylase